MILFLIGMSNVGKSYWSRKLETEQGFHSVCCDDLIAEELSELLPGVDVRDMNAFAAWMGMPFEFGYQEREAAYVSAEQAALKHILDQIVDEDIVIDTTGSVVYLPDRQLRRLKEISTVVYLATSEEKIAQMTEAFFSTPKPLVWGQVFSLRSGENNEQALRRCYPELLRFRQDRYEALADVTIGYEKSHDPACTSESFLYDVLQHQRSNTSR